MLSSAALISRRAVSARTPLAAIPRRHFATAPASEKSMWTNATMWWWVTGITALGGGGWWYYAAQDNAKAKTEQAKVRLCASIYVKTLVILRALIDCEALIIAFYPTAVRLSQWSVESQDMRRAHFRGLNPSAYL